jgi:hypothetical protein
MKRIALCALVLVCLGSISYGQGPWSNDGWRGPRPRGPYGAVWNGAKRVWEIVEPPIRQAVVRAYEERRNEQLRYDAALRWEWEAHQRAAYAERTNPSSWQAQGLRQAANRASMERARAEAAVRLRTQNDTRSIYGVSLGPNRQEWIRPSPVNNVTSPNTHSQSRQPGDRDSDRPSRSEAVRSAQREFRDIREAYKRP